MSRLLPFYPMLTLSMLALVACGEDSNPTQPEMGADPMPAAMSVAAAPNTWTPRAGPVFDQYTGDYSLGMAPNSAGQSIVYTFGSVSSDDGATGGRVQAYNVSTNTWRFMTAAAHIYNPNGVSKIGNKLYFSGGYIEAGSLPDATRELWAYDYSNDRMIRKADLPIFSAEGVSGVIDGKLYVLPGACNGNGYPNAGYCVEEQTRRFYRYDPAANTWVSRRQAPHFHRKGAAVVIDGKFYVAGGFAGFDTPVAALDVYDPTTNTWRTLASMPKGGVAAGAGLHGKFYVVIGGQTYAYNPVTDQWKTRAPAPSGGFGSVTRVTLDGRTYLFMATGNQGWLYTP
jgi:N-acetylneuraminic acid mutarotase